MKCRTAVAMCEAETASLDVTMAIATEVDTGTAAATVTRLPATEIDCSGNRRFRQGMH